MTIDLSPVLGPPAAYAGIGSRETPHDALDLMTRAARWLAERGWTLRSGAAPGADSAFEAGALQGEGSSDKIDLFLPWPDFEGRHSEEPQVVLLAPTPEAIALSLPYHPAGRSLTRGPTALHGRNAHQILGERLDTPSAFVLCWTRDGADGSTERPTSRTTGGTGQAIRIAAAYRVPVYNLQRPEVREAVEALIGGGA